MGERVETSVEYDSNYSNFLNTHIIFSPNLHLLLRRLFKSP